MESDPHPAVYIPGPITEVDQIIDVLDYDQEMLQERWDRYQNDEEPDESDQERRLFSVPATTVNILFSKDTDAEFVLIDHKSDTSFFRSLKDYSCCDAEERIFAYRGEIRFFRQFFTFISGLVRQGLIKEVVVAPMGLKPIAKPDRNGVSIDGICPCREREDYEEIIKTMGCILILDNGPDVDEWLRTPILVKPVRPFLELGPGDRFVQRPRDENAPSSWYDEVVAMEDILFEKVVCIADIVFASYYNGDRHRYFLRFGH
ncbi:hypothetical protein GQ602_001977 [Ophiocordyceps camponoti-floridani]|uniref:Uncharacterized protein n=1 Tax=Ophiocordyceps camponoti-floridani TaxID=2030778 RepID=A0A8H4Q9H2_9HYPO|nr:hypothetical protein GQ602_001977 [Ophiocordyceps camponoti-floridani]